MKVIQPAPRATMLSLPRTTRCHRCGALAREEVRERTGDDDVAIRYRCPDCSWHTTHWYHESELD